MFAPARVRQTEAMRFAACHELINSQPEISRCPSFNCDNARPLRFRPEKVSKDPNLPSLNFQEIVYPFVEGCIKTALKLDESGVVGQIYSRDDG
jgi:hypothetical protein